jgi:hypothetical protein
MPISRRSALRLRFGDLLHNSLRNQAIALKTLLNGSMSEIEFYRQLSFRRNANSLSFIDLPASRT